MCWNKIVDFFYPKPYQPKEPSQFTNEFSTWAFGEDYPLMTNSARIRKWNELHGHLLIIDDNMPMYTSLNIMLDFYQKHMLMNDFSTRIIEGQ